MVNRQSSGGALHHGTGHLLATQGSVIGVAVSDSGTRLAAAAATLDGIIIAHIRKRLPGLPDAQTTLAAMHELIAILVSDEKVQGSRLIRCGVAIGALLDSKQGVVRTMPRAEGWDNLPLLDLIADRWQVPTIIENNVNAAALGEMRFGAGCGNQHIVYLSLGRSIKSGIVLNGQIYHGAAGLAGEIGHIVVKEGGPRCPCGGYGHLEAIASARAIVGAMIGLSAEYPETLEAIHKITGQRAEALTVEQVFHLLEQGNPVAQYVAGEAIKYLAIAIVNLCNMLDPATIVIGGTMANVGDRFFVPLREQVARYACLHMDEQVCIVPAELGEDAAIGGAIALALHDM
jgi:glucokinase